MEIYYYTKIYLLVLEIIFVSFFYQFSGVIVSNVSIRRRTVSLMLKRPPTTIQTCSEVKCNWTMIHRVIDE